MTNTHQTWKNVKIQDVVENLDNKRVPVTKSDRKSGQIPYYGATGVVDYVDDYIFDEKLLLIGEDGADWSAFANSAYIIDGKSWVNNHAHVLRVTGANIHFLMEYLNFSDLRIHVSGTTRGKLNKSDLMNIQIPLPSIQTQQKISNILMSVNNEIEKTDQIIQKTEVLKKGLMDQLLTKGIGHNNFKNTMIGKFPIEWDVVQLSEVAKVERGKFSHRPRNAPEFYGGSIPFIQTGDVVNSKGRIRSYSQTLNEKGLSVSKLFNKGTIVLTIAANIGDTGILEFDACFPDSLVGITPSDGLDSIFLEYYLRSQKSYLNSISTQSAQKNINLAKLNPMLIAVPPIDEQREIGKMLSLLDDKLMLEIAQRNQLNLMKSGLMNDIFSRKVEVN